MSGRQPERFLGYTYRPPVADSGSTYDAQSRAADRARQVRDLKVEMEAREEGLDRLRADLAKYEEFEDASTGGDLPQVSGERLQITCAEFIHRCRFWIGEEAAKVDPNNALIGLLCDAVRFARQESRL